MTDLSLVPAVVTLDQVLHYHHHNHLYDDFVNRHKRPQELLQVSVGFFPYFALLWSLLFFSSSVLEDTSCKKTSQMDQGKISYAADLPKKTNKPCSLLKIDVCCDFYYDNFRC